MSDLVLVVNVKVDPGHTAELKPAMLENAANSVEEEGCYQFDVIVSLDDPDAFVFYEVYRDTAALESHKQTPHFQKYWDLMQGLGDKVQRSSRQHNRIS